MLAVNAGGEMQDITEK